MKNKILLAVTLLTTILIHSQRIGNNPEFKNNNIVIDTTKTISKIVALDKVVHGFGPSGNFSIGIGSRDLYSEEELKGYPVMKNLPDSLTNIKEYLIILNDLQFYYQNYKQGIYSKEFFLKKAEERKRKLSDTIHLTDKTVKNTISIVSGLTADNRIVYIVDTNNNNDYSDDELKPLLFDLRKHDDIIENSQSVDIEYFDGNSIKNDKQLIRVGNDYNRKDLMFSFPQFRYGKVELGNETYLIISESFSLNNAIYLVKDRPYFSNLDRKDMINPYQYFNANGFYIQYSPVSQHNDKVKLTISTNDSDNKKTPIAAQVGMIAPNFSGINVLDDMNISLEKYRGKYVYVDFWSSACPPCIIEFPNINEAYNKFNRSEIEFIGIADIRGKTDIKKFVKEKEINWPTINEAETSTITKGYNVNSWPTTYLIDPTGKIIATNLRGKDLNNKLELLGISTKN
ncbi:TlpA disulfide reductase family protein [Siansivirga zeaxanthinifaciens]|uniref:Thioredoxin n=1 Tax=Siansivirga zeaxanthinifaciens CC-SAMT-1 TaxID=1454006 RepID=A0A0C5VWA6_9FLAO|nr:TlpA disulfide reductase family protein [Siansivirga zeaxanthinifaciens]AJR03386.1 thioredoxin [Siansivirga zeaxanthinifaciens CC-SAMT-1]